jgi:hypothetical protein
MATNNNQLCKNMKEVLICNPELSLQMNHPVWNKWMNQIPFLLLFNTEHAVIFGNGASWTWNKKKFYYVSVIQQT